MRTILAAGFLAAFVAAGACGGGGDGGDDDDSTGPGVTGGDTIRFSLAGPAPLTFDVRKSLPASATACDIAEPGETWACAFLHGAGDYWILGTAALNDSISTTVWIVLDQVTAPGTLTLGSCTANCVSIMSVTAFLDVKHNCCSAASLAFIAGSVEILSVGSGRIRGTFSAPPDPFRNNAAITNGYFNLRIRGT